MPTVGTPWYKRPWGVVLICVTAAIVAYLSYFLMLVGKYTYQFKTRGDDVVMAELERNQTQASVSKLFASKAGESPFDRARIEPSVPGPVLGDPKAKVRIVEFLDYGCPFCRTVDPVVQAYVSKHPDEVYLMLRDLPITELHPQAEDAAVAARCVWRQGDGARFWRYHSLLFAHQEAQDAASLRVYAEDVGADLGKYDACMASKAPIAEIQGSVDDAISLSLQGTPTFFFNGVPIQGAMDDDTFAYIIEEARRTTE